MTTVCTIGECRRPVLDGAPACHHCVAALCARLRQVPGLRSDLLTTLSRLDVIGGGSGGRGGAGRLMPVRLEAGDILDELTATLTTWARVLAETPGLEVPRASSARGAGAVVAAAWLHERGRLIRRHEAVAELIDECGDAMGRASACVDRPAQRIYLGPCGGCGSDLYGPPGASSVSCPVRGCPVVIVVADRQAWLADQLADWLMTGPECASALSLLLARPVPQGTIRQWVRRARLVPRAEHRGHALFRFADARYLAEAASARRLAPQARAV